MHIGTKSHEYLQREYLQAVELNLLEAIGGRYKTAPEDYPPSEWIQYKQHTEELQAMRERIGIIIEQI